MENMLALSNQSISDAYTQYARSIFLYIYYKVEDEELAHDLVQDTFLRLISYRGKICFHTVKHLLFIIARNLVNTRVRDKDCVKNRVKRAKIVRFTLC